MTDMCGAAGGRQPAAVNPPCMLCYIGRPTLCSMSFIVDHSQTSTDEEKLLLI